MKSGKVKKVATKCYFFELTNLKQYQKITIINIVPHAMTMKINELLQENDKVIVIERPEAIVVTKNVVKFGSYVYQFRNVTGFGLSQIKTNNIVPIQFIILLLLGGLILLFQQFAVGILILVCGVGCVYINISQPKKHGLELYVNSGNNVIFITTDKSGIRDVVSELCKFMESDIEEGYIINIDQRSATIGVGYAEKVSAGKLTGNIDNRQP